MKPADRQLIEQYPLPVQFPGLAGEYLMLDWWSHNEQHHISLGKTEAQIFDVFRALLRDQNYCDAEPKKFYKIEIVGPPLKLQLAHAEHELETEIRDFTSWVGRALDALKPAVPDGYPPCPKYRPRDPESAAEYDYMVEQHMECKTKNCHNGFIFDAMKLYQERRSKYLNAILGESRGFIKAKVPSRAPLARPGRKLYAVEDRHGHHSDGSVLTEIKSLGDGFVAFNGIKFFCHATEIAVPEAVTKCFQDEEARWKKEREDSQAQIRLDQDKVEAQYRTRYLEFFRD